MRVLRQLRSLTALERRELVAAMALLPVIAARLRLRGVRATQEAIASAGHASPRVHGAALQAHEVARLVAAAARWSPWRPSCMTRSLALQCMLLRHGLDGRLRLGVRRRSGALEAHAWIEHGGAPLMESAKVADVFAPLERAPPTRSP